MRRLVRRLWLPTAVLSVLLGIALARDETLGLLGTSSADPLGGGLVVALLIALWMVGGLLLHRFVTVLLWEGLVPRTVGREVPHLVVDLSGLVVAFLVVTGIVAFVFERSVAGLLATSGVLGLVIGFALQPMILDVFAGLAIHLESPFRLGEWVTIYSREVGAPAHGKVMQINWRTTRIVTREGDLLVVPNRVLASTFVLNHEQPTPETRYEVAISLDASVPAERSLRVLTAAVRAASDAEGFSRTKQAKVKIDAVDDVGVRYSVRYYVRSAQLSPGTARHKVLSSLLHHLTKSGIPIAYPKEDIFYAEMPTRQIDTLSVDGRAELLNRTGLFRSLAEEERIHLATRMVQREFAEGEDLIVAGDDGESMFVLVEGLLGVLVDVDGSGVPRRVGQVLPGAYFGEMSLLTGEPRSATLRAETAAVAYEIGRPQLRELLEERPEIGDLLSRAVAEHRLHDSESRRRLSEQEREEETQSVASQIMNKMRSLFGTLERRKVPRD